MKRFLYAVVMLVFVFPAFSESFAGDAPALQRALAFYRGASYKDSAEVLQEHVKTNPDPVAYYLLGYSLYKLKRFSEASECFRQAYLIDPAFAPEKSGLPKPPAVRKAKHRRHKAAAAPVSEPAKDTMKQETKAGPGAPDAAAKTTTKPAAPATPKPASQPAAPATPKPAPQPAAPAAAKPVPQPLPEAKAVASPAPVQSPSPAVTQKPEPQPAAAQPVQPPAQAMPPLAQKPARTFPFANPMLLAGVGGLIIVAALVLYLLKRKKKA